MNAARTPVIGVDFDNTVVTYDELIHHLAVQEHLIPATVSPHKKQVRDSIRQRPDGELAWQRLQAVAYGMRMPEARLIEGVAAFFAQCRRHHVVVSIISHKSSRASVDDTATNLQQAAREWMRAHGFFSPEGLGLAAEDVWFEPTRQGKLARIAAVGCTHFIDDLEETFLEPLFPASVEKILYAPYDPRPTLAGARVMTNWREITDYFFSC